jgi:hypothetical protein
MKTLNLFIFAISMIVLVESCKSTGMRALTQGKYDTACLQAIDKLRSSPNNEKAKSALMQAYPLAVSYTEKETERLLKSVSDDNQYQKIFDLYGAMNNIAIEISRCPAALLIIPHADYYNSQLETARNMAAEELYLLAVKNLNTGTHAAGGLHGAVVHRQDGRAGNVFLYSTHQSDAHGQSGVGRHGQRLVLYL